MSVFIQTLQYNNKFILVCIFLIFSSKFSFIFSQRIRRMFSNFEITNCKYELNIKVLKKINKSLKVNEESHLLNFLPILN